MAREIKSLASLCEEQCQEECSNFSPKTSIERGDGQAEESDGEDEEDEDEGNNRKRASGKRPINVLEREEAIAIGNW